MTSGDEVFRQLQRQARAAARETGSAPPTQEYLTRYGLEGFLDRLTRTPHADHFVLKGGLLIAVYNARRPTRDIDSEAVDVTVTPSYIEQVVRDVAAVRVDDGLTFDLGSLDVREIRDNAEYPGIRTHIKEHLGGHVLTVAWDVPTGDPIVPAPHTVAPPRLLGGEIEMDAYRLETVLAEKGVTILERGITSTRWRDYVDIVRLARTNTIDRELLLDSARAVARFRGVELEPIAGHVGGYGEVGTGQVGGLAPEGTAGGLLRGTARRPDEAGRRSRRPGVRPRSRLTRPRGAAACAAANSLPEDHDAIETMRV